MFKFERQTCEQNFKMIISQKRRKTNSKLPNQFVENEESFKKRYPICFSVFSSEIRKNEGMGFQGKNIDIFERLGQKPKIIDNKEPPKKEGFIYNSKFGFTYGPVISSFAVAGALKSQKMLRSDVLKLIYEKYKLENSRITNVDISFVPPKKQENSEENPQEQQESKESSEDNKEEAETKEIKTDNREQKETDTKKEQETNESSKSEKKDPEEEEAEEDETEEEEYSESESKEDDDTEYKGNANKEEEEEEEYSQK